MTVHTISYLMLNNTGPEKAMKAVKWRGKEESKEEITFQCPLIADTRPRLGQANLFKKINKYALAGAVSFVTLWTKTKRAAD